MNVFLSVCVLGEGCDMEIEVDTTPSTLNELGYNILSVQVGVDRTITDGAEEFFNWLAYGYDETGWTLRDLLTQEVRQELEKEADEAERDYQRDCAMDLIGR